jgi:Restriction endonuclease/Topoisomerase DNA binding C4 zinc finger
MARRQRNNDLTEPIAAMTGIGGLAAMFVPGFTQVASAIGWISLIIVGSAVAGFAILGIFRLATPERNMKGMTRNVYAPPPRAQEQKPDVAEPEPEPALTFMPVITTTELLQQLRSIDWFQFEKLVGLVYRKLGYDVTRRGGANPDGGIDLVIQKDGQCAAIQCKQWKAWRVGVKQVREFLGTLTDSGIQHGRFITLRGYTNPAMQFARKNGIEIITEVELTQMLESTDARLDPEVLDLLHDARKFCPKCEREMVMRVAEDGPNPGGKFWGCSGYPRCHFTMPIVETNPTPVEAAALV